MTSTDRISRARETALREAEEARGSRLHETGCDVNSDRPGIQGHDLHGNCLVSGESWIGYVEDEIDGEDGQ